MAFSPPGIPREVRPAPAQTEAPKGSPGKAQIESLKRGGGIIVEALLNRKVTAPLLLDTGASHTILTRQTARELGLPPVERLPRKAFHTAGGVVLSPVTTLQSVRVGSHEVRDVEVAIDVAEHLSIGLLGMTFLRHFKVTVNQEQGQVKFER
jgi:clan AA aspartic protease (TIGR02281 family)